MKKGFLICAFLTAVMIISPLLVMEKRPVQAADSAAVEEEKTPDGYISVMLTENGFVNRVTEREYVIGAVAAEMNISCHDEALKAQAVACYTYALYCKMNGNSDELNGADISDSSETHQGYLDNDARKEKWGDNYDKNEKKLEKIVDSVLGRKMTYNSEPIMAVYHDLNSGSTQSAETVWGKDVAYLQPVQSRGDTLSTEYCKTVVFTKEEFEKFAEKADGVTLSGDADSWLGKIKTNDSGYVETIELGGKKISGRDFRKAFSLRSCVFTAEYGKSGFTVTTYGNGHCVGMSQYGADYMARQGSDWKEILKHYYVGIKIE